MRGFRNPITTFNLPEHWHATYAFIVAFWRYCLYAHQTTISAIIQNPQVCQLTDSNVKFQIWYLKFPKHFSWLQLQYNSSWL